MKTAHDLVAEAKALTNEISVSDAQQAIQNSGLLIDVREADEFALGHLPGAVHMSRGMIEFKFSSNPELASRNLRIVLYCKSSGRAALAAVQLQAMGYHKVSSIAGGYDAWVAAGKPTVKPALPNFE